MYTEKTRELFADLIERPPLTDQLLQRPPFRFLHDVVKATIQNTGFLLYCWRLTVVKLHQYVDETQNAEKPQCENFTSEEMDASKITDKTTKANFLKRLIKALNNDGSLNDVKVAKIIAGKEPEMTNLMLQKLAIDATKYRNSKLKGTVNEERQKKETKAYVKEKRNKEMERKNDYNKSKKVEKEKRHSNKDKERKKKEDGKKPKIVKQVVDSNERPSSIYEEHFQDVTTETSSSAIVEQVVHMDQHREITMKTEESDIANKITDDIGQPLFPATLNEQPRPLTSSGRPRTSANRLGISSARPPPPKIKKKRVEEIERKTEVSMKTSGIIIGEREESDENYVEEIEPSYDRSEQTNADEFQLIGEEHGGLVRKILETKKGLEDKISKEAYNATISVFDEKDQAKSQQELINLQNTMQQITQITHLLARFLDNAQEDAEDMFKELEEWRSESTKNMQELRERKANTEGSSANLLLRLNQLDEQIKEVKSAISQSRAKVIANEEKIRVLVNNI